MNKVFLMGRLGADPEVRVSQSGKKVAKIRIAVDRRGKDAGADWFDAIAWERQAEFIESYLGKGRKVAIEGRVQNRSYEKDGQKHFITEIMVDNIEFADSKPKADEQQPAAPAAPIPPAPQSATPVPPPATSVVEDDIPF